MKKIFTLLIMTLFYMGTTHAAEIPVASNGDIAAAISGANDGDAIVLADGGTYTITATIELEKTITIMAAEGSATKPKIKVAFAVAPTISTSPTGAGITLIGIEIEGSTDSVHFIETSEGDSISHVKFFDVDLHDFGHNVIVSSNANTYLGEVIVENSHIHDFTASTWRLFWIQHNDINYVGFKNSTFNNFTESLLYLEGDDPGVTNVDIHNCTVDGKTSIDAHSIIKVAGEKGGNVSIKNTIFTNLESYAKLFEIDTNYTDSITNSRYYLVGNTINITNDWSFESEFVEENPDYQNAANDDFTLPRGSALLTAGTDGGIIGDPRWTPAQLSPDIIAYWSLDETTGITAIDEIGNSNGTLYNMGDSLRVDGWARRALDFGKGSDSSYVEVPDNAIIDFDSTASFSISALVKIADISSSSDLNIVFKGATGKTGPNEKGHFYGMMFKSNELRFVVDDDVTKTQLGFPNANQAMNMDGWNHIVGVRDISKDTMYLYLNGKMVASVIDATYRNITSGPLPLIIGNNKDHNVNFLGVIDELQLFNIALGADDIYNMADGYDLISSEILVTGITLSSDMYTIKINEIATLTAIVEPSGASQDVEWKVDKTDIATIDAFGKVTGKAAGTVTVTATATGTSVTKTIDIVVKLGTGIYNLAAGTPLNLYPNPTTGLLHISNATTINNIEILDITGKLALDVSISATDIEINVYQLESGLYIIRAYTNENVYETKFIKK